MVEYLNKLLHKKRQFYCSANLKTSFETLKAAFNNTITLV